MVNDTPSSCHTYLRRYTLQEAMRLLLDSIITNTVVKFSYTNEVMQKLISLGATGWHSNGTTYDIYADGIRVSYDDCSQSWSVSSKDSSESYFRSGSNYRSEDRNKELAERWMAKVQDKLEMLERKSETKELVNS
tara:strand:- start:1691 stop:2095 length:405 start_codon:yes stop_codon:yes gene_type:complete